MKLLIVEDETRVELPLTAAPALNTIMASCDRKPAARNFWSASSSNVPFFATMRRSWGK